jgi:hypothetical protein
VLRADDPPGRRSHVLRLCCRGPAGKPREDDESSANQESSTPPTHFLRPRRVLLKFLDPIRVDR